MSNAAYTLPRPTQHPFTGVRNENRGMILLHRATWKIGHEHRAKWKKNPKNPKHTNVQPYNHSSTPITPSQHPTPSRRPHKNKPSPSLLAQRFHLQGDENRPVVPRKDGCLLEFPGNLWRFRRKQLPFPLTCSTFAIPPPVAGSQPPGEGCLTSRLRGTCVPDTEAPVQACCEPLLMAS